MQADVPLEAGVSELYVELKPLMFSIAYRMVGTASDAEDIVQEAFLRFHRESGKGKAIDSPKAYLSTVTTRLSIDHLRSARVRRERYFGTWLPERCSRTPRRMRRSTRRRPIRSRWRFWSCWRA
jgi:RNA polymerase sigma factor (sigma-70 family)